MLVIRNVDVGSDHDLLVAKMTLKLKHAKIGKGRSQRPDISKLKDTLIEQKFNITLKNRLSILQDETALTIGDFNTNDGIGQSDNRMHKDLQIRMDLPRYMKNNRREETVEEKGI